MSSHWIGLCEAPGGLEAAGADGAAVQSPPGRPALVAAAPFGLFYYRRVAVPSGRAAGGDSAYIAGAIDPDLPVAVEDCVIYASHAGAGVYGVFAAERVKLAKWLDGLPRFAGRSPDCVVPAPLAVWRFARGAIGATPGAAVHIHADAGQWLILAGRDDCGEVPESVTSVEAGDIEGVCRSVKILLARMRRDGDGAAVVSAALGADTAVHLAAFASRLPEIRTIDLSNRAPSLAALAARYAESGAIDGDAVPPEMEGAGMAAVRSRRLLPPFILLAAASLVFCASAVRYDDRARAALRESDSRLTAVAESLAGCRLGPRGAAALAPAVNAFNERRDPAVSLFASADIRGALRPLFAFADARSFGISRISLENGTLEADISARDWNDVEALVDELCRSGLAAFAERGDSASGDPAVRARVTVESAVAP